MNNQPTFTQVWENIHNQLQLAHKNKIETAKRKFAKEKEDGKHYKRN
jgi:hypothetical protein